MEMVVMDLHSVDFSEPDPLLCAVGHDHHTMKPIVLSTWQHTQLGACPEKSTLIPESQVRNDNLTSMKCIKQLSKQLNLYIIRLFK